MPGNLYSLNRCIFDKNKHLLEVTPTLSRRPAARRMIPSAASPRRRKILAPSSAAWRGRRPYPGQGGWQLPQGAYPAALASSGLENQTCCPAGMFFAHRQSG